MKNRAQGLELTEPNSVPERPASRPRRSVHQRQAQDVDAGQEQRAPPRALSRSYPTEYPGSDRNHGVDAGCQAGGESGTKQDDQGEERLVPQRGLESGTQRQQEHESQDRSADSTAPNREAT